MHSDRVTDSREPDGEDAASFLTNRKQVGLIEDCF